MNPNIFESNDGAKLGPFSYRTINQDGDTTCRPSFFELIRIPSDALAFFGTGEFDLSTLLVDRKTGLNPERKVADSKISGHVGWGLIFVYAYTIGLV